MKTISEVIEKMPRRTYASRAGYRQAVKRACLRLTGCEPIPAATDRAGNCLVCGELAGAAAFIYSGKYRFAFRNNLVRSLTSV